MKSWKMRLGLVLTALAMLLAVSIPAMAEDLDFDGLEDSLEDEFVEEVEIDDVDCFEADEDGDGLIDEDLPDGFDNDFDGEVDEEIVCIVEFEIGDFEGEFVLIEDFDLDGIEDDEDDDDDNDGIFDDEDDDDDNDDD